MPAATAEPAGRQSGSSTLKQFYVAVSNNDVKLVRIMLCVPPPPPPPR